MAMFVIKLPKFLVNFSHFAEQDFIYQEKSCKIYSSCIYILFTDISIRILIMATSHVQISAHQDITTNKEITKGDHEDKHFLKIGRSHSPLLKELSVSLYNQAMAF